MFHNKIIERVENLESKLSLLKGAYEEAIAKFKSDIREEINETVKEVDTKISDFQKFALKNNNEIVDEISKVRTQSSEIKSQLQKEFKSEIIIVEENIFKVIDDKISLLDKGLNSKIEQLCSKCDSDINELKFSIEKSSKDSNDKEVAFKKYIDTCISSVNKTLEDTKTKLSSLNEKSLNDYQIISKKIENATNNFNSLYLSLDKKIGDLLKDVTSLNILKTEILNVKTSIQSNKDVSSKNLSSIEGEIKELSSKLIDAKDIENKLNTKLNFLCKQIQYDTSISTDKKMLDFKKDINEEYYKALQKIFEFNKKILEQAPVKVTDEDIEKLRKDLSQKLLEAKWAKQKAEDGGEIVNRGVDIINRRKELHEEMLRKEKRGGNIEGLKEQIKAFDWIIERVKK